MTVNMEEKLREIVRAGRMAEFTLDGSVYVIQQENNKGWNYLSIWCTTGMPVCLGRAFFDIFDGLDDDTLRELLDQPCFAGRTLRDRLPELTQLHAV